MPMIRRIPGFAIALLFATAGTVPAQVGTTDTRLLSQPAASATHVAFAYAGALRTVRLDGSDIRRLSSADGDETPPVFSRDGRWIPQLDRAVAWVMEELRKNPPATLKRPVFRDKTKAP